MSDNVPSIGIDFGTTNSSMAWFDPRTGQAEVILNNAEGEAKAPSPVYFSQDEALVGKLVGAQDKRSLSSRPEQGEQSPPPQTTSPDSSATYDQNGTQQRRG